MRISQAYVSKSVSDFPFHQIYSLDDYCNKFEPAVFFGMYRYEDYVMLEDNTAKIKTIFWTGQDALDATNSKFLYRNVTAHHKVYELIRSKGYDCELVNPSTFLNTVSPQTLGKKIYAYCPNSELNYHGKSIIDELRRGGYDITIGDGQWTQDQWRNGKADEFYDGVCVGLCLSSFAGGGTSIIEMGLRGINVITNVFTLPNCIPWVDAQDVANKINAERIKAGESNGKLAKYVWNALDHDFKWLEI